MTDLNAIDALLQKADSLRDCAEKGLTKLDETDLETLELAQEVRKLRCSQDVSRLLLKTKATPQLLVKFAVVIIDSATGDMGVHGPEEAIDALQKVIEGFKRRGSA